MPDDPTLIEAARRFRGAVERLEARQQTRSIDEVRARAGTMELGLDQHGEQVRGGLRTPSKASGITSAA